MCLTSQACHVVTTDLGGCSVGWAWARHHAGWPLARRASDVRWTRGTGQVHRARAEAGEEGGAAAPWGNKMIDTSGGKVLFETEDVNNQNPGRFTLKDTGIYRIEVQLTQNQASN